MSRRDVVWLPPSEQRRGQYPYRPAAFHCCAYGVLVKVAMDDELPATRELRVHRKKCLNAVLENPKLAEPWDWVQVAIPPRERVVTDEEVRRYRPTPFEETVRATRERTRRAEQERRAIRLGGIPGAVPRPDDGGDGKGERQGGAVRVRTPRRRTKK